MKRFKSYVASKEEVSSFLFNIDLLDESEINKVIIDAVKWALRHKKQNFSVELIGRAYLKVPQLNESRL